MPPEKRVWEGPDDLKPLTVSVDSLKYDPDNLRAHTERGLNAIKASLNRFGQQKPVVITSGSVVKAGNLTLKAAKALGWTHIAVSTFNGSDSDAQGFGVADNRVAEHSYFPEDALSRISELMEDFSPDELGGWDGPELDGVDIAEMLNGDDDAEKDDDDEKPEGGVKSVRVTEDQWQTVKAAIEVVREATHPEMSAGSCVELICADYLSGNTPDSAD